MSTIKTSLVIETPFARAADLIERFLTSESTDGGKVTLHLSAPGAGIGLESFAVGHDVVASFRRRTGPNETIVFDLHWESADGGPFPIFDGTLTIAEDETYETCRLLLDGSYTPPGHLAGAVFDAALGSRIAHATAQELLERMRSFLRQTYEATELAKSVSRAPSGLASGSPAVR